MSATWYIHFGGERTKPLGDVHLVDKECALFAVHQSARVLRTSLLKRRHWAAFASRSRDLLRHGTAGLDVRRCWRRQAGILQSGLDHEAQIAGNDIGIDTGAQFGPVLQRKGQSVEAQVLQQYSG